MIQPHRFPWLRALLAGAVVAAAATHASPLLGDHDCPAIVLPNFTGMGPGQDLKITIFTIADGNCVLGLHCISTVGVRAIGSNTTDFKTCWVDTATGLRHCASGPVPVLYVEFTLEAACGQSASQTFFFYNALDTVTGSGSVTLYCDACG